MIIIRKVFTVLFMLVCIINISIKDTFYWSSLFFYAFPKPIIILLSIILVFLFRKSKIKVVIGIGITLFFLVTWVFSSYRYTLDEEIIKKETQRNIVFWNARKQNDFIDAFEEFGAIPDLLIIVEYDRTKKHSIAQIKERYPNYHFTRVINKIGVMSKNEAVKHVAIHRHQDQKSFMFEFEVTLKNEIYHLYVLDITADLTKFRKQPLQYFYRQIKKRPNTILVGDFNTPYESVHFGLYKKYFNHAFTLKGKGFRETWFWNIPLLSLDHIWMSKDITIKESHKVSTWKSDHVLLESSI